MHTDISLLLQCYPPFSLPTISTTLTFQLRVPALPRSHSIHFSSPPPPTVHRFNHECLFPSRGIRISLLAPPPPSSHHNLLSFFRSTLCSFPIFGSCRSLTPFLPSSSYPSFSIRLGLHSCLWIFARLSKASFSAVFRPDEFGPLLFQPLSFYLSHVFPFLSHPLCARSI